MSHTSPAANLVWALLSTLLGSFLLFHLWSFDRFKCLKWNNGPYSGAFKRIMTYSYLLSVPLIITYAVGFAVIKYKKGFVFIPGHGIVPVPYQLWDETSRNAIFPLYLTFSVAWSLEMVTHLEELCFWLFLVNAGQAQQDWFRSLYFKTWLVGSGIAVLYMPLITIFTRGDPLKCEAYTFLAGSLGSLSLTLWFLPVLWTFPTFLNNLRREKVDMSTVIRLTKFHEMNTLRVFFRFLFVVPLVCLGIDGVRPHPHVNESMVWTDLLAMISALGCVVSSGITLVIFFPRSIEGELAAKEASRASRASRSKNHVASLNRAPSFSHSQSNYNGGGTFLLTASPVKRTGSLPPSFDGYEPQTSSTYHVQYPHRSQSDPYSQMQSPYSPEKGMLDEQNRDSQVSTVPILPMRPNRRTETGEIQLGRAGLQTLSEENLTKHNERMSRMNHLVYNFTSPIDLMSAPAPARDLPMSDLKWGYNNRV